MQAVKVIKKKAQDDLLNKLINGLEDIKMGRVSLWKRKTKRSYP